MPKGKKVTDTTENTTENETEDSESTVEKFPVIAMSCPPELKAILETKAKNQSLSTSRYCLNIVAEHEAFTLPEMRTRASGGLDEETKKAKAREASKVRTEIYKAALRLLAEGKLSRTDLGLEEEKAA